MRYIIFASFMLVMVMPNVARPIFTEVSASAGINYIQYGASGAAPLPAGDQQPYMSGGAAAGDFDGDGWVDLYVTRQDAAGILYRNKGDGTFEDATTAAFGANYMRGVRSNGAAWGDIDNDGDLDLYVTTFKYARHLLFINDGQGKFTEEGVARGADVPDVNGYDRYGFSSTFGDYDGDGYLDMHVTEWRLTNQYLPPGVNIPQRSTVAAGDLAAWQILYDKYVLAQHNTRLLRNLGAANPGHFEDVTDAAGVAVEQVLSNGEELTNSEAFASRFSDIDRDGYPDLLIASDHKTSRLFWNNGDGTFTDGTVAAGVGTDHNGMGSAVGDYDGDGDLDWFVTSIYQEGQENSSSPLARNGNRLFSYNGDRTFSDVTDAAGVRDGQWGWGAAFIDYDNDGDLDISMTNGIGFENRYATDKSVFFENDGTGSFSNVSDAVSFNDTRSGKGLLTFDYDKDGDLDIFIANNAAGPLLYRNDGGNDANWLRLDLEGSNMNSQAFGTFVVVIKDVSRPNEIMVREVNAGSNFLGQNETTLHFGLGAATSVDVVVVEWGDGSMTRYENLLINTLHEIVQPSGVIFGSGTGIEPLGMLVGELLTFPITTNVASAEISVAGLPVGLSYNSDTSVISGTPTNFGAFSVVMTALFRGEEYSETFVLSVLTTYELWAANIFTGTGEGDVSVSGPSVDFDADGRTNFQEYVEQTDPKSIDYSNTTVGNLAESLGSYFAEAIHERFRYASDLNLEVEIMNADGVWKSAEGILDSTPQGFDEDDFETIYLRFIEDLNSESTGLIRVKYSKKN